MMEFGTCFPDSFLLELANRNRLSGHQNTSRTITTQQIQSCPSFNLLLMLSELMPTQTDAPGTDGHCSAIQGDAANSNFMDAFIHPDYFYKIFSRKRGRPSLSKKKDSAQCSSSDSNDDDSVDMDDSLFETMSSKHRSKKSLTSQIARERKKGWEKSLLTLYSNLYAKVSEKEMRVKLLQEQVSMLRNLLNSSHTNPA
ncbi:hypothetical protein MDAP_000648 [Mitosporidium daphniae]|uniref:Uncharacterized protein n=1 Tax=Mitosporidium daphniae TaxID=1485682 RepID=A0A098VUA7_9MICR|nr:uncharacterized protein DI09_15p70 [Mitosporidium daphniae]KGG52540.1 hypothetical protein DI09_15p70 [Mitosporidium daphniae]|eukprot:XP_013239013.1 uncharacterized protein DI09_15p70 [Mitosporidium daphniae]